MSDKVKNIIVTISFIVVITIVFIVNIINEDKKVSLSERRKLQQFPNFSIKSVLNGSSFKDFEKYTMDQFIQREAFRSLKTNIEIYILKKQDSNNIYEYDNKLIEQIYPLNEKSVVNIANKMNDINTRYLDKTNRVYYTIVPDKNYFVNSSNLKLDYNKLQDIMSSNLKWANYINIFDCLDLSCYYATDSHWKQEKLQNVVKRISTSINLKIAREHEEKKVTDFKGVYAGQFPIKSKNDEIIVLINDIIENCTVYNQETNEKTKIYNMEKINAPDKYDIYLSGSTPLLTIENSDGNPDKELVVFRDSYGSSLIPLLVEAYSKITVIDTRYISPKILDEYVEFKDTDVLFIYSTLLINNSTSLK